MKQIIFVLTFIVFCSSAIAQTPKEQADEFFKIGEKSLNKKDYKKAVEFFTKVIDIDKGDANAYAFRGQSYHYMAKYIEAMEDYNKAIELEPNYAEVYHLRGIVKGEMEDNKGACTDWEKAFELGSNEALELLEKFCNKQN